MVPARVALALVAAFFLWGHTVSSAPSSFIKNDNHAYQTSAEKDLVLSVPGYDGELKSRHYAGYIPVSRNKRLFYYLVESERSPESDPVVLWLNGGPGCSSLDGFVYEMGPFLFNAASNSAAGASNPNDEQPLVKLLDNPYAWNKVANMIYLDSPAGVGLSYSSDPSDYVTGDRKTAVDAQRFLRRFFERHWRFQSNPFYISGESYAGIYVPNLATAVAEANDHGEQPPINLAGYIVGNGCTSDEVDGDAFPDFAVGKSLMSREHYDALKASCGGVYWNRTATAAAGGGSTACDRLYFKMTQQLNELNLYDVLEDCYRGPNPGEERKLRLDAMEKLGGSWPAPGAASRVGPVLNHAHLGLTPPCTDSRLADAWINHPSVRAALHAAPLNLSEPSGSGGRWQLCSDRIAYTRDIPSTIPLHRDLTTRRGLRALIYSGDHDLCVPHTGSERWTQELGYPVLRPWGPWFNSKKQVGGYAVEYQGLTYCTVKGAGHMVPQTRPLDALDMFQKFISKGSLHTAV